MGVQRQIDNSVRHWIHARVRFRDRYGGKDLPMEEWERANALFHKGGVKGQRYSNDGKIEAWIEVMGEMAYAVYNPSHRCIVTFLPRPAEMPTTPAPQVPPARAAANAAVAAITATDPMPRKDRNSLRHVIEEHNEEIRRLKAQHAQEILNLKTQKPPRVRTEDVSWFKDQIRQASSLLWKGKLLACAARLEALAGTPKVFYPSADRAAADLYMEQQIAGRAEENRIHWSLKQMPEEVPCVRGPDPLDLFPPKADEGGEPET